MLYRKKNISMIMINEKEKENKIKDIMKKVVKDVKAELDH